MLAICSWARAPGHVAGAIVSGMPMCVPSDWSMAGSSALKNTRPPDAGPSPELCTAGNPQYMYVVAPPSSPQLPSPPEACGSHIRASSARSAKGAGGAV
ncbi:hypothetical protein CLV35_3191 [Motilibacter peucedani]|uniref:Uncharacterized protein n=1 Tax=Motilibacter peucedani TaxID=598650 RepID=A0A420XLV0_9ACTN|nr:hypothetical protein [Motilibacter peucedani]RKS71393.1 hypothetical protein CLV35_3191 [Motilibacter peucedani]